MDFTPITDENAPELLKKQRRSVMDFFDAQGSCTRWLDRYQACGALQQMETACPRDLLEWVPLLQRGAIQR